ncbi:hypothetical protein SEMRO_458_G147190.1 [Seminavis robusta]|uniref:Uncharacterized protein n=1 Tax=Seminavis robusta TaxID=568900 RepID=A0A9N8DY30_9STRA|nr:hypothetical protein SEMRO_458_G147190.1 [Seminavis robusta]|eukprot:Sro458_g147190.1 n/a (1058) ;mRNA; r:61185-64358
MAKRRTKRDADAETPDKWHPLSDQTNRPAFSPAFASPPPKRGLRTLATPIFKKGGLFASPSKETLPSKLSVATQTDNVTTKCASTQTDAIPSLAFENEIITGYPGRQLQQQVYDTLNALHSQQKDKDYVRLSLRHGQQTYLKIPNLRVRATKNASKQASKKLCKNTALVSGLLDRLFGVAFRHMIPNVLASIGSQFRLAVVPIHESALTICQAVALRDFVPTSTRGLERLANALHDSAPFLGNLLFPKQLRRRISEYEQCTLDVELSFEVLSLEMNGDGKMKPCPHAWVSNPPIVIEGLTRSALVTGKFQESSLISAHNAEILVVQGCDKGGNLTLSLMRIANRLDGNAPSFCFPLAFYEDGRESYGNLARTIYDNSRPATKPIQPYLQALLDGKHHIIVVSSCQGNETVDAQCLAVEFEGYCVYKKSEAAIQDSCNRLFPDADHRELSMSTEDARSRKQPTVVTLDKVQSCPLAVRLVQSNPTKKGDEPLETEGVEYSGILLYQSLEATRTLVSRLRFTSALFVQTTCEVKIRCYACRPFTADDLKLNIAVSGQGTAASKYPCPICIASSDEFAQCVHGLTPSPLREGEFHNDTLYTTFMKVAGGRSTKVANDSSAASMKIKRTAKSVVARPLLLTPPSQNTAGSMHVCQGMMTHLTRRTFKLLQKIDRKAVWYTELKDAVKDASDIKNIKAKLQEMHQQDRAIYNNLQAATKWPNIPSQAERAKNLLNEREQHTIQSAMVAWAAVVKAGEELSASGSKFVKDSGSKPEGEASYLLYQSFCVDGGVKFNVEHSGLELTNANGIKVLSKYKKIASRVEQAYCDNPQLQEEVKEVMTMWRTLAELLLEISAILKRQCKLSDDEVNRLKLCAEQYGQQWISMIPGKDTVFNKLHTLIAHLTEFAEQHKTIGLVNEESFEATHPRAQTISNHLKSMVSTEGKVTKTIQRFSLGLNNDYQTTRTALQDDRKMGQRKLNDGDKYKVAHRSRQHDMAPITNQSNNSKLPDGLVHVDTNQSVVKAKWLPYYDYLVCSRVPPAWRKAFADDDAIGSVYKVKSEYV